MTVYFWTPDENAPAGGIRAAYRFVDALNANGTPAAIMHQRQNFRATWFPNATRVIAAQSTEVFANDLLVLSELDAPRLVNATPNVTKVILNQNHRWTFVRGRSDYRRSDVAAMIVVSEDGARYMRHAYPGLEVIRIRYGVDTELFSPGQNRKPILLYHSSKGALGREIAVSMLHMRGALQGWEVETVSHLGQLAFAQKLGQSAALLTASQEEGFPLLLVEAMAAGCAVIGYPGGGAEEYMTPEVAWPVPTGDHLALARAAEEFINDWTTNRASVEARTDCARSLIERRFNLTLEAEDIVSALRPIATKAASRPPGNGQNVAEILRFESTRRRVRAAVRALVRG